MPSHRSGKSQRELIFDCISKLFTKLVKNNEQHTKVMNQWHQDFDSMAADGYFTAGLPWAAWPAPRARQSVCPRANAAETRARDISGIVPSVLHAGWTRQDRNRAEVQSPCQPMLLCSCKFDMHMLCG